MSQVLQYNQKVPIGLAGGVPVYASWDFLRYMEAQRSRTGGDVALTNVELERAAMSSALTVYARGVALHHRKVEAGPYIQVSRAIDRFTVSVDIDAVRAAIVPFIARQPHHQQRPDDASAIIASRVFGAR